jgi:hypothetical protein|tara:strand:+ start:30 stop:461 length:432 start_codon:yes stop_codon:yes gene_type:complete
MKKLIKILILFFVFNTYSQKVRYLMFNKTKDFIETYDSIKVKYYHIDENLFKNIRGENNYSIEIDTISLEEVKEIKFYLPKELSKEVSDIIELIKKESLKTGKVKIIPTYNEIFEYIYILEKITSSKFKRTRVWYVPIYICAR